MCMCDCLLHLAMLHQVRCKMHTVSLPCQPLPAHCIRTTLGNMVACLGVGEHFSPTCACPARYNAWARSSRLETRTKESSMPASSWVAAMYVCATKILAGICAPATNFSLMGSLSVSTPARTRKMVSYACGRQTQGKL